MGSTLRSVTQWSTAPAKGVQAVKSWVNVPRGLAARATIPLLPDDYLKMLNPLWSARELRGLIVGVQPETVDSATVTIKPGWGFSTMYRAGQYVGIGLRIEGRWHWRSYSLTSIPRRDNKNIMITVKATPEGFLSTHLVNGVQPGTIVRLALPKGDFALPDPPPAKILFITAGSGITPVMAMLRTLESRGQVADIAHIHSAPGTDAAIFHDELVALERDQSNYRLHLQLTETQGKFDFGELADTVTDWQDRSGNPLHRMGVGQHLPERSVEALAQLYPPQVHQHRRPRRRRRLRDHARHSRRGVGALDGGQPDL